MTAKELNKAIEQFFSERKSKDCATYESLIELFEKQPTAAQAKMFSNLQKNMTHASTHLLNMQNFLTIEKLKQDVMHKERC